MTCPDWTAAAETAANLAETWAADAPGGAILGFDATGVRFTAFGGLGNLADRLPFTADTVARWASVTKHVFAAMTLDTGLLPLDMPLGAVLEELVPAPAAVTVRQALSMQGGLPDNRECLTLLGYDTTTTTRADPLLAFAAGIGRLNAIPGTEVSYSNTGYRLAEAALARRGAHFADLVAAMTRRLGVGMRTSEYWTDPVPGLVPGHIRCGNGWAQGFQGMHLSAAGSASGSVRDLAGWLAELMTRDMFAEMAAPVPLADGRPTGYGLGLRLTRIGGRMFPGHGGSQPGYRADFLLDPETRSGIAVLTNRDDGDAHGIAQKVIATLFGLEFAPTRAGDWAPPGLYVAEEGNLWLEAKRDAAVIHDAEESLYRGEGGAVVSRAAQNAVQLARDGDALVGEIGHRPCRLVPARNEPAADTLDGFWECRGAMFSISGERIHLGRGPQAVESELVPLGGGRWLFRSSDGRRICLRRIGPEQVELSLARARVIEYRRIARH